MTNVTVKEIDNNEKNVRWIELNGTDHGTDYEFDNETYGITEDDRILNCDGCPITEGDYQTIAVRNSVGI